MKVGDLCRVVWSKEILVYLGEGCYAGWYSCMSLTTGVRSQYRSGQIEVINEDR